MRYMIVEVMADGSVRTGSHCQTFESLETAIRWISKSNLDWERRKITGQIAADDEYYEAPPNYKIISVVKNL